MLLAIEDPVVERREEEGTIGLDAGPVRGAGERTSLLEIALSFARYDADVRLRSARGQPGKGRLPLRRDRAA